MNILIVDDSKATLEIIQRALIKFDYRRLEIKKSNSPIQALELIKTWQPDIILTDWHMPEMSGLEFIQAVSKLNIQVKIGMITTVDDDLHIRQAKQAGAAFVLTKPFTDETLHRYLLRFIQESEDAQILPNQSTGVLSDGIALPKLPQLEKLLKKVISPDIRINKIQPQRFDTNTLPCLVAIYVDAANQKTRAIALLDIYAICIYASHNPKFASENLKKMMLKQEVDDEVLTACKKVLKASSLAFLDRHSRFSLKLKSTNIFHHHFDKLEMLYNVEINKRIDFSCQVGNLAQGKVTMVGM